MKLLKKKVQMEIKPISMEEFRQSCFKNFRNLFFIGFVSSVVLWMTSQYQLIDFQFLYIIFLVFFLLITSNRYISGLDIRPRLKSLYGVETPSFNFILSSPAVMVLIYSLLLKQKDDKIQKSLPFYFRNRIYLLVMVIFLNIGLPTMTIFYNNIPNSIFWGLGPLSGYLTMTASEAKVVVDEKEKFYAKIHKNEQSQVLKKNEQRDPLSSISNFLGQVIYLSELENVKSSFISSEKNKLFILSPAIDLFESWHFDRSWFTKMSPINFLSPVSLIEASLLCFVENISLPKIQAEIIGIYLGFFEKILMKYPNEKDSIAQLKERVLKSPSFQYVEAFKVSFINKKLEILK